MVEGTMEAPGMFPGQQARMNASDQKSMDEDELKKIFRMFDADGSGEIDTLELHDAVRLLGLKCSANGAKKVLSVIDQDGNGKVDWKEFYDFFRKVRNPEEIKNLLANTNQRFLDYKSMVEMDPNFQKRFYIPEMHNSVRKPFDGHNDNVESVAWLSDTQFISCSLDSEMRIWDIKDSNSLRTIQTNGGIYTLCVIPGQPASKVFVGMGTKTDNLSLWDLEKDAVVQKYEGHPTPVFSVVIAPDKRFSLSGSKGGCVCFHDVAKAAPVCALPTQHDNVVYSCDFNEDGTTICTASGDGTIKVSDMRALTSAKAVITIDDAAATGICYQALWSGENHIVSCGDDYCIKRWDIRNIKEGPITNYFGHTSAVRAIALTSCKQFMISATNDGSLRLWIVDEQSHIGREQDDVDTKIEVAEEKRRKLECDINEGTADITPEELEDMMSGIKGLYDHAEELKEVRQQRADMGCVQAVAAFDAHTVPAVSVAVRDDPTDNTRVNFVSAAQDQSLRLFNCAKPMTTVFRR